RRANVTFSEPMDPTTLVAGNFTITSAGADKQFGTADDQPVHFSIQSRNDDTRVQLTFAALGAGTYRLTLNAKALTDRAGNALGQQNIVSKFSVSLADPPFSIVGHAPAFGVGLNPDSLATGDIDNDRSEEHTSELQSRGQ